MPLKDNVSVCLCIFALCSCIFTLGNLVVFLSSHSPLKLNESSLLINIGHFESIWLQVLMDALLVGLFVLQHSLQNHKVIKDAFCSQGSSALERLFYNLGSCLFLVMLMQFWQPISSCTLWKVETSENSAIWCLFGIIHSIAWLLIYSGCYIMDPIEFLGVKQVFHSIQEWPEPLSLKSEGLKRFYSHYRHPGFSAMTAILFIHPVMQLDRLLLAYGFVIFTVLCTKVDEIDYAYQLRMLQRKKRDLNFSD